MNKHRMIDENSSGSENVAKRVKTKDKDLDPVEIHNLNSLIAMPDEILEKIFTSLDDLADKKSFAESCKKFNGIFDRRKNLEKIWLKVPESKRLLTDTLRPYSKLELDGSKMNMSNRLWKRLDSSLSSIKISLGLDDLSAPSSFLNMLPRFTNLAHLDLDTSEDFLRSIRLNTSRKQTSKLNEMVKLTYLRIDCKLFSYLDGYHINFAATKKLQTLILNSDLSSTRLDNDASDFSKIRSFISNQSDLKTFHLHEGETGTIFDHSLNIQSKLEELNLYSEHRLNADEQNNICDFINDQNQLKRFKCDMNILEGDKIPKMRQFFEGRLNLPLKAQNVYLVNGAFYSSKAFSVEDIVQGADQPNLTTEELLLNFAISDDKWNQVAPLIIEKFPNLKSIEIAGFYFGHQNINGYSMLLDNMKKLESVTLRLFIPSEHLKSITIPGLKRFHCCDSYTFLLDTSSVDLIEFLSRHEGIQDLLIHNKAEEKFSNESEMFIKKVTEYAVKLLKNLSCLSVDTCLTSRIPLKWFIPLIRKHAKPGFVFKYNSIEIMKRYDNKIVQKFQGRWQLHEIHAVHM